MSEILELRGCLLRLLDQIANQESLRAELSRGRREFFGAEQPAYAKDEQALEVAAIRFAEWFLLERCSEQLGEIPILLAIEEARLSDAPRENLDRLETMAASRAGVFISEAKDGDRLRVRDLGEGERLDLTSLPNSREPGDILVGRLYEHGGGAWLPSVAMAILPASPELAVAYQKDLRQLELERRLTQAELEHLLFRRWAECRHTISKQEPLEHLEVKLAKFLSTANVVLDNPIAEISSALRGLEHPGAIIGPILDQFAFDSDVDLGEARKLLTDIWSCQARAQDHSAETQPEPAPKSRSMPATKDRGGLGKDIAARLEEGLARHEDLDSLFQELGSMAGEASPESEAGEVIRVDSGDLEPLLREFVWEEGLLPAEEATLLRFLRSQQDAPIPKNVVEYLDRDDLLRFLLGSWLESAPSARVPALREHAQLLQRFFVWVQNTQSMDVSVLAEMHENPLLNEAERLDAAGQALSTCDQPEPEAKEPVQLMKVTEIRADRLSLLLDHSRREVAARISKNASDYLQEDDLMFGRFSDGGGRGKILGMVVVVPGALQHLLG